MQRFGQGSQRTTTLPITTSKSSAPNFSKQRWTKNEEIRLICCLLDEYDREGSSFLEYFKRPPSRAELNASKAPAEAALAERFNDQTLTWPQLTWITALKTFDPTKLEKLHLPRQADDIMRRFKGELAMQVKAFVAAFKQSGKNRIDLWEWGHHPVAEVVYKTEPTLLQLLTGSMLQVGEGMLSVKNAELGFSHVQADESEGTYSEADAQDEESTGTDHTKDSRPDVSRTPDFVTPVRRASRVAGRTAASARPDAADGDSDLGSVGEELELRSVSSGSANDLSSTTSMTSSLLASGRRRRVRRASELQQAADDPTADLRDIHSISHFIATNGAAFVEGSRKKRCLSDSQTKLALTTFQETKRSEGALAIANALQNLADAMHSLSRK